MKTELKRNDVQASSISNEWIPTENDFAELNQMDCNFSLTTNYKTADDWAQIKDSELCCFYIGLMEIPNEKGELVVCGKFIAENGPFISGQMVLVEAVKNLLPGTPMKITYKGKRPNKSSDGSTMLFEIKTSPSRITSSIIQ